MISYVEKTVVSKEKGEGGAGKIQLLSLGRLQYAVSLGERTWVISAFYLRL